MIQFEWKGVITQASIVDGQWVHGLPEVAEMLASIAPPEEKDASQVAADRLGGTVVTETTPATQEK